VTEAAALAAAHWVGKGDAAAADKAAINTAHSILNDIPFSGRLAVGEGARDTADRLFEGEIVGQGGPTSVEPIELAVDSLECTRSVAFGRINALSVVASSLDGGFFSPPTMYLQKMAVGADSVEALDFSLSVADNLHRVAEAKGYVIHDLTVVILDRERHSDLIKEVRRTGARIHLIPDGDLSACLAAAMEGTGIDMVVGTGASATGVLSAAAMRCLGGELLVKLAPTSREEADAVRQLGIHDLDRVYGCRDLVHGADVTFTATGVTDGDMLNGVRYRTDRATTHSIVLRSHTQSRRHIKTEHFIEDSAS
jgi:fructose-1,6-bisphosphatase II